jgi:transcriptional regulator with XRE-family HTH domain
MQHVELSFDDVTFFEALERRREAKNVSWRHLGRELGLSPSTFSRLARGRRPDIETFVKLLAWLDIPAEAFMRGLPGAPEASDQDTLAVIAAALRSDRTIPADAAGAIEQLLRVAYTRFRTAPDDPTNDASGTINGG